MDRSLEFLSFVEPVQDIFERPLCKDPVGCTRYVS